jgi:hypothetical protein
MIGEPQFVQLPGGGGPFLARFVAVLISIFLVVWESLPFCFDAPTEPVHIQPIALPGQSCAAWEPIINGRSTLSAFWAALFRAPGTAIGKCKQLVEGDDDPRTNPGKYIRSGDAMAMLDPTIPECRSDEARGGVERYLLILCSPNPATFGPLSWTHETWHVALGHTVLRHTFLRTMFQLPAPFGSYWKQALNAFLDSAYVDPAFFLGRHGAVWFRTGVFFGGFLLLLRKLIRPS